MDDDNEGRLVPEILYLACTRPAMKWGVPVEGFLLNCAIAYLGFMVYGHANVLSARGLISLIFWPIGHLSMRALVEIDHNIFRLLFLRMETSGIRPFGVSNLWSISRFRPTKPREMTGAI